jgi:glycosyltransferase involved in cell wall biosynthesis
MSKTRQVSVIITSYNYDRFLEDAIDSALEQTYPLTEVIVVDDGSQDGSQQIITGYGDQIIPLLKENGGQASAFNAGFAASHGDVILFLDSDDSLLTTAVEKAATFFDDPDVAKVHWPLWVLNEEGRKTGKIIPRRALPAGDLRDRVFREGPINYNSPPTSGNAWARKFLERVLPMPEIEYRTFADGYLIELAPFFGSVQAIAEPQGFYRMHGQNNYLAVNFDETLALNLRCFEIHRSVLSKYFVDRGIAVDTEAWKANSWWHRLRRAIQEIAALIPPGDVFVLIDEGRWGTDETVAGRRRISFAERDGQYLGRPPDDETAIREVERLRQAGARFMAFGWPAFWWLDYYGALHAYLRSHFPCLLENERLVVFDLRQ